MRTKQALILFARKTGSIMKEGGIYMLELLLIMVLIVLVKSLLDGKSPK
nr:MAG TPA: hypothetical protein [Caudoviricetes sp.]